ISAKTFGVATPRKPVLSVSARKIKDNAADWHNLILKWESLNDAGFATANSIANLKISLLSKDKVELESCSPAADKDEEKSYPGYNKELEMLCEELQATLDGLVSKLTQSLRAFGKTARAGTQVPPSLGGKKLVPFRNLRIKFQVIFLYSKLTSFQTKIQVKMEKLTSTTKGICDLENYHYGEESQRPLLFHTWPTADFYAVSRRLSDMYAKELLLKRTIVEELAHSSDHDLALSYLSMWLHQPYVENSSQLLLEGMLLE
uniref:Cyclin dependent kinase 2 interacting protein n=1 Tax=Loxodonta africana TaxID=9785 RepID=G3UFH3_LOXAF